MLKYLVFLLLCGFACWGQTPILSLFDDWGKIPGAYHKDIYNDYDKFVGTWKYEENGKVFIVVFKKQLMQFNPYDNIYMDILIGEYKYSENGIELVNTLSNLIANPTPYSYNISGAVIKNRNLPASERGLTFSFVDPERDYLQVTLGVIYLPSSNNLPPKINVSFRQSTSIVPSETSPREIRIPLQEYVLTKVN